MEKRIVSAVILAILGFVGSGIFPAYADAHPTHADTATVNTIANHTTTIANNNSDTLTQTYSPLQLAITSVGNSTIREGEKLRVEVRIVNESASSLTLAAELRVHEKSFATRSHLLTFIDAGAPFTDGKSGSTKNNSDELVSVAKTPKPVTLAAHSEQTLILEATPARLKELSWDAQNWGPRGIEVRVSSPNNTAYNRSLVIVEPNEGIKPVPTGIAVPLTDSLSELSTLYATHDLAQIRTQPTERIKNLAETMTMKGVSVFADPAYAYLSKAPQTIVTARANADILGLLDLDNEDLAQSLTSEAFKGGSAPVRITSLGTAKTFAAYTQLGASAFILNSAWCNTKQKNYATPATHTLLDGENNSEALDVLLNDAESARVIVQADDSLHARQNALALSAMTYLEQPSIIRPQLLYFDLADDEI